MLNQKYYEGYYDYFSPKGKTTYGNPSGGGSTGLYDAWSDIYKYQQDPSQLQGQRLKDAKWWMRENAWKNYADPWNFASTHYNLYPTGGHADIYNNYLQSLTTPNTPNTPNTPSSPLPAYNPEFEKHLPDDYKTYLTEMDKVYGNADLPASLRSGYLSDQGMWGGMKGKWDQAQSQANVNIGDVANYAATLRGVEEPLYAQQTRRDRLGLENRLLSQGMLGSTGGASQTQALHNAQAQAAAGRDASRYQRAEGMQQQNYQNQLAALQGGQTALTGLTGTRQAQQGYEQQNFANQLAAMAGKGGLFTGFHNIATDRGLGESSSLMNVLRILGAIPRTP